MILVDYSQTAISNIMQELGNRKDVKIEIDLIRHMIINSIRSYKQKFGAEYGEMIICCDDKTNWRAQEFEYYKAARKKRKDDSYIDWVEIGKCLVTIRDEIKEYLPYRVVHVGFAEGDDVIAAITKWSQSNDLEESMFGDQPKPLLILSRDSDFTQLHKYDNVKQYSPITKQWIRPARSAQKDLLEKIICGDTGDGIPNFLSDDDTFVAEKKRQKSIFKDKLEVWLTQDVDTFCDTEEKKKNFERNKKLIDFECIPEHIHTAVVENFTTQPRKTKSKLMDYFMKHRMKHMIESMPEF